MSSTIPRPGLVGRTSTRHTPAYPSDAPGDVFPRELIPLSPFLGSLLGTRPCDPLSIHNAEAVNDADGLAPFRGRLFFFLVSAQMALALCHEEHQKGS